MNFSRSIRTLVWVAAWITIPPAAIWAQQLNYLITNDDPGGVNSVSFFANSDGKLTLEKTVFITQRTYGFLIFNPLIALTPNGNDECIFVANSESNSVTALSLRTQAILGSFTSTKDDGGRSMGIVANDQYLYASFVESRTLATFKINTGCQLTYVSNQMAQGLNGGAINGMALHGNILVVAYGDGSIQSFNVEQGPPVSNQDEQNSSGYTDGNGGTAEGVDITADGRFAIFGDFTGYAGEVEVAEISSGKLRRTIDFGGKNHINGSLGSAVNSTNVWLSPDETLLYISNSTSGQVTAARFDKVTGVVTKGCTSGPLKGYPADWFFTFQMATGSTSGTGSPLYVVEQGFHAQEYLNSYIGVVNVMENGQSCELSESVNSEVLDPHGSVLSSFAAYPPRAF